MISGYFQSFRLAAGEDFEFKIFFVAEAIGFALDDADVVVDAFEEAWYLEPRLFRTGVGWTKSERCPPLGGHDEAVSTLRVLRDTSCGRRETPSHDASGIRATGPLSLYDMNMDEAVQLDEEAGVIFFLKSS
jgi:hypothetical protein